MVWRLRDALVRCVQVGLIAFVTACAPPRGPSDSPTEAGQERLRRGSSIDASLDVLGPRIDALAAPWPNASNALSLVRDSGEARALTPRAVRSISDEAGAHWEVVYGVDPTAIRSESDRTDAAMLRVTEWISCESDDVRGAMSDQRRHSTARAVTRRFVVEGLAAGRTVVVDVPLRVVTVEGVIDAVLDPLVDAAARAANEGAIDAASPSRGERWQASVNGASVDAPLGVEHVAIELARDEATVIRIGRVPATSR